MRVSELRPVSFRFAQFFISLYIQSEQVNYQTLYRLSSETLFDWWAVSRSTWLKVIRQSGKNEEQRAPLRSAVQDLLESKPDDGTMILYKNALSLNSGSFRCNFGVASCQPIVSHNVCGVIRRMPIWIWDMSKDQVA